MAETAQYVLDVELAEIKRGLTLLGVMIVGAAVVASIVLAIVRPGFTQPRPEPLRTLAAAR
jgi:Tfp pilus assembly protein PilE